METTSSNKGVGKGRLIAFRVLAVLSALVNIIFTIPGFLITWFDHGKDSIHHVHLATGIGFGLFLGVGLLLSAWKPEKYISLFQCGIAVAAAGLIEIASSDFLSGFALVYIVAIAILVALHPARDEVLKPRTPDLRMAVLPVLSFIPAVAYGLTQSKLQKNGVAVDPHVELHHYSGIAWTTIGASLAGLGAAMRTRGYRLSAWFVGVAWVSLGAVSLRYPKYPSALESVWAWAALACGVAFVLIAEAVSRTEPAG